MNFYIIQGKPSKKKNVKNFTSPPDTLQIRKFHEIFSQNWHKWLSLGVPPLFSPKNKCVLNDSLWPEIHFGIFFCEKPGAQPPPPPDVKFFTFFFFFFEGFP